MRQLVLIRHGESVWNRENRFTGWTDVDLSETGVLQARQAGSLLKEQGFAFDVAFTSYLKRAIKTLHLVLENMDELWIPEEKSWRLNERFYGALQGLDKTETARKYGEQQVQRWRREPHEHPPAISRQDRRYPGNDSRYQALSQEQLPLTENLAETMERVLPYWRETIAPEINAGKRVLIVAHGNSLRALVQYVENLPDEAVSALEIPTGAPLVYELDDRLRSISHRYLS